MLDADDLRKIPAEAMDEGADAAAEIDEHCILRKRCSGDEAAQLIACLLRRDVDDKLFEILGKLVPVYAIHESLLLGV